MGEGHWVEVRVGGDGGKALRQLRKELAEEGVFTQDVMEEAGGEVALAVGLVGGPGVIASVASVMGDWIRRRKSPGYVVVRMGDDLMKVEKEGFEGAVLEGFLGRHQQK
ncbi:hypothetical protein AB0E69_11595 [Kribbella sp. NPDC026611]|uniref:hypothetical protein n=1 Tax=Kribbella sp. NPDC026611 TaxID=3154911 RepID=UPI0033F25DBE